MKTIRTTKIKAAIGCAKQYNNPVTIVTNNNEYTGIILSSNDESVTLAEGFSIPLVDIIEVCRLGWKEFNSIKGEK